MLSSDASPSADEAEPLELSGKGALFGTRKSLAKALPPGKTSRPVCAADVMMGFSHLSCINLSFELGFNGR